MPDSNPVDIFRLAITEQVSALTGVAPGVVFAAIDSPRDPALADLAIAVPRLHIRGNLALEMVSKFRTNEYITSATLSGPFFNFTINHDRLRSLTFAQIHASGANYGHNASGADKRAVVEFSSPTIGKPFHADHLRSTIIGNFTRNALKVNGWDTVAMNHVGDWPAGKHQGMLAAGFARYGDETKLKADPVRHLVDVYVQISRDDETGSPTVHDEAAAWCKRIESGEVDARRLWQRFRDVSMAKYREIYARLGIEFDAYSGESQVGTDQLAAVVHCMREKDLLKRDDGALIVDLTADKLGVAVVQKSEDNTYSYLARDLGHTIARNDQYAFDAMYYVVDTRHDLHFRQLFRILERLEFPWAKSLVHLGFGRATFQTLRRGNVVWIDDMLDKAQEAMLEVVKRRNQAKDAETVDPERVADQLGLSAIVVQESRRRRGMDYAFDWDRILAFEGDTGPYLQLMHARLCSSIEFKSGLALPYSSDLADLSLLTEPAAKSLVMQLAQFPDLVRALPTNGFEPINITTYLFKLCHTVSSALGTMDVVRQKENEPTKRARTLLLWSARVVLGNGLRLLGLRPLERI
ncbi:hypothetical protein BC828DRAFT_364032 [Blastocladiella britannica]|nr:hypothetical protein BC828DRAFT_364032 [Blastocladiella britannica]